MSNGEVVSSGDGLIGYFRRCLRTVREPVPELERRAARVIRAVRRTDTGRGVPDTFVWWVTAERLARDGYWSAWMLDHCVPRCPKCGSELKFRPAYDGLEPICATNPSRHGAVGPAIREQIADLYAAAFDEEPEPDPDCLRLY